LEPGQPSAVAFPASSEAIDALPGAKRGSPRVVPDEIKLAITDSASHGFAMSKTFGAVRHCYLLSVLSQLFVDHRFFADALHLPVRFSDAMRFGAGTRPALDQTGILGGPPPGRK
jgi:hypothetical protein